MYSIFCSLTVISTFAMQYLLPRLFSLGFVIYILSVMCIFRDYRVSLQYFDELFYCFKNRTNYFSKLLVSTILKIDFLTE